MVNTMKIFLRIALVVVLWLVYPLCVGLFGSSNLTAMISLPALLLAIVAAYYAVKEIDKDLAT